MAVERTCRNGAHPYADRYRQPCGKTVCAGCYGVWKGHVNRTRPVPESPAAAEARERGARWAAGLGAAIAQIRRAEGFDGRRRTWQTLGELLVGAALAAALLLPGRVSAAPAEAGWCAPMRITGYVRSEFSPWTYDGTSIYTDEPIVAASWNIPIDSVVEVEGVGTFRVADRGHLGSSGWIDVAVWSRSEAYALTSTRTVCVSPPEEAP